MKRKWLIVGMICLFIGTDILPAVALNIDDEIPESIDWGRYHDPIHIDGNTQFIPDNGVTSGNGTVNNPYLIENWVFTSDGSGQAILIVDTTAYFIIRNCTIRGFDGGIWFIRVANGAIEKTTIETTPAWDECGIIIDNSHDIMITDNIINADITNLGMELVYNITISGNLFTGWLVIGSGKNFIFSYNTVMNGSLHVWDNCICESNNIMTFSEFYITSSSYVKFFYNYWGGPRLFPKIIFGRIYEGYSQHRWFLIDWHPAQKPYDISVMSQNPVTFPTIDFYLI